MPPMSRDDSPLRPGDPTAAFDALPPCPAPVGCGSETPTLPPSSPAAEPATLGTTATPATPGRVAVPGYEILSELGRGGMGVVYKARQTKLGRLVALKMILSGGHAGENDLARFRTEAEAIARLQHPNIVQIHEVGEQAGRPFFSLEFCAGGSLEQKLAGTPLPPQEAAHLAETLARAMHAAHEAGVVHRDLKPANVLLTTDGTLKITDFGLAKKMDTAAQTASGAVMGTPSYMAPEQAGGKSTDIGPRTDVYGLGTILYELLTGRPPFRAATTLDTILQVVSDEPVPPKQLQPKTSRDLETICLKCLQKEPAKRYLSAAALADDLRRFQNGEPIQARPVGHVERSWRWCRRNPAVAGLTGAVAVVLLVGTLVAALFALQARKEKEEADQARRLAENNEQLADGARKEAEKQLLRSEWLLYAHQIALAQREWRDGNVRHVSQLLDSCRPDFRGWEHNYLHTLLNSNQITLRDHSSQVHCVAFSRDGKWLASGSSGFDEKKRTRYGEVKVWDVQSGKVVLTFEGHTGNVLSLAFSPDSKRIASASGYGPPERPGQVKVWDVRTGEQLLDLTGHTGDVQSVAFSADGKRIVSRSSRIGASEIEIIVWDAQSGHPVLPIKEKGYGMWSVAFSPDGKRLAAALDQRVKIWDAQSGKAIQTLKHANLVTSVAFSPDGKRLAAGSAGEDRYVDKKGGQVKIWDASSGEEIFTLKGHSGGVNSVAFSPDSKRLVSAGGSRRSDKPGELKVWEVQSGEEVLAFQGHTETVNCAVFSPDGNRLASGSRDGTIKLWDAQKSQETLTLMHTSSVSAVAFSPNGKQLASTNGAAVSVWDARSNQQIHTIGGHHFASLSGLAFSPDSKWLACGYHDRFQAGGTEIKVWDAQSGKDVCTLKGHTGTLICLAFSPDGIQLASGGQDGTVKVWDTQRRQEIRTVNVHRAGVVTSVAFSPDANRLVCGCGDGTIKILDAHSGEMIFSRKGHSNSVACVAFTPDGKSLASGSFDGSIKLWDIEEGRAILTLTGHVGIVTSVVFSPDGKRLASGGGDNTVKIWEAHVGQELLTLQEHPHEVSGVAFSPDGKRLASASFDKTVRIWDADR